MMKKNVLIVLNYNDSDTVERLLNKIKNFGVFEKIVIVDNNSTDNSYEKLQLFANNKIDVIQADKNGGYAYGNNYGAKYAIESFEPDVIFFANPDVLFEEEVPKAVSDALFEQPEYAVGSVLVEKGYNVWKVHGFLGAIKELFLIAFRMEKNAVRKKVAQSEKIAEVGVVEGSFFAIKRAIFEEISGFDERTFLYLEENILARKILQKNYKEIIVPGYRYIHEHSKSIRKQYKSKANAFKLFKPSYYVYLEHYLGCTKSQLKVFDFFYYLAYLERKLYDLILKGRK